jgi:hypothetical protein
MMALISGLMFGVAPVYAGKHAEKFAGNSNYWLVGETEDHTLFHFIDASTITYDGSTRSAWLSAIAAGKGIAKYGWRRKMSLTIFNCERSSLFESRIVTYDQRGVSLLDHSYDNNDFRQIIPGGVDATEIGFVCANPDNWTSGKNWTKINVTPEIMSDDDNKTFQNRQTP